jgi:hypothetical protein
MMNPQEFEQLETEVQAMKWENVSLEPDPADVERFDQELPQEWTTLAEPERDTEYTSEELQDLLNSNLDIPEGDIDQNARQALNELTIDLDTLAQERDLDLDIDLHQEQEFDFDR